ncbi:N-acetylmuramoyl-L-alanine amidase [Niallia sp. 03190]|uniref:N-acetylmuramoyl-L-alanine amidase n=1 Tax=Niallia sp. 03190 TaxID=3458061 RepID=UPI004043F5FE
MNTRKNVIYFLLSLLMILFFPTMKGMAESSQTVSSASIINIREGPNTDAAIIGQMEINTEYPIVQEQSDWIEINLHTGKTGWVASWLVSKSNSGDTSTTIQSQTGFVKENGLRLRNGPGTNYLVINTLSKDSSVTILSENGDWIKIETAVGTGWVHKEFVEVNADTPPEETDVSTNTETATVSEKEINVRNSPSTTGDIIGKLAKDSIVHIVSQQGNWSNIQYSGNSAWVNSDYLDFENKKEDTVEKKSNTKIAILYNGTNIRSNATVHSNVKLVANKGDIFQTIGEIGDWYKIELSDGDVGYVANWIVKEASHPIKEANAEPKKGDLKDKVIVIDPGHGGKDSGTIGIFGTLEKDLTIRTAHLLADKLKTAGSNVILTRSNDSFLSLQNRVNLSSSLHADAFISIHYDSVQDPTIMGMTSYYYTSSQKELANELHESIIEATNLTDRGVRQNNYFVLRENTQPATLLELGYLSNASEEQLVATQKYQETVSTAIYQGLANYFQ